MYIYSLFITLLVALHTNPCTNSSLQGLATPHLLPRGSPWPKGSPCPEAHLFYLCYTVLVLAFACSV